MKTRQPSSLQQFITKEINDARESAGNASPGSIAQQDHNARAAYLADLPHNELKELIADQSITDAGTLRDIITEARKRGLLP